MSARKDSAFLFDLDGTLIDSVYQHVIAWREALEEVGVSLAVWKIHRRIGMSGGLFVTALRRELGVELDDETLARLPDLHAQAYARHYGGVRPLPGARELLGRPDRAGDPVGDRHQRRRAHGGPRARAARPARRRADGHPRPGALRQARPGPVPDRGRLASASTSATRIVVGDSVWDLLAARRAGALGIGLLSGGYGREELIYAGAFRVYEDPGDLLAHLDEVGVRRPG